MATLAERPAILTPPATGLQARRLAEEATYRPGVEVLAPALAAVQPALALVAAAGTAVFVPSLIIGRTALFWPSARWLLAAGATLGAVLALWWLAGLAPGASAEGGWLRRWRRSAWPTLVLLPAACAAAALYADDASNHLATAYAPATESLLAYAALSLVGAHGVYWSVALLRPRTAARPLGSAWLPPLLLAVACVVHVNASIYLQWIPHQTDLLTNLTGARALRAGDMPYNDVLPIWENRVHLLPVTLLLLFGPLSLLPDDVARALFFLGNQALWVAAMWLFVKRLAPADRRWVWLAGALILGATYWPWQESIRFGQQDGLLSLLFVASITAVALGRERSAGIALGLALIVKPLSIWLPLAYLLHGRWRALLIAGVTAGALSLLTLPFTGWAPWWHFVSVELPAMLPGTVRGTNIPLPSLHARLFVLRESLGDAEPAPTLGVISAMNLAANVLGLLLVLRMRLHREPDRTRAWLIDAAMGLTLTLLLAPMAWQHYASWLAIAFLILALPKVWRPLPPAARVAAAVLAGAGYLLLSLEDDKLLRLLGPLVDRWPATMSFYAPGLLCIAGALAVARFARRPDAAVAPMPAGPLDE